jgi:hypothetical protein
VKPTAKKAATKQASGTKPASAPKQELAKTDEGALANSEILDDVLADAGAGNADMTTQDMSIPRITILQSGSPQVKKREATYVDGAEEGMIMDTVTSDLFDGEEGLVVIPCSYRRTNLEWIPREAGGGLAGDHGNDDSVLQGCTKNEKGQMINSKGNAIVPTAEYFILVYDPETGNTRPYVLSMASTQLKHSRKWNTTMNMLRVPNPKNGQMFNPAMFYRAYKFTTVPESNDSGSWFGWKIENYDDVLKLENGAQIYLAARALRESVNSGAVQASKHESAPAAPGEDDDAPM